MVEVDPFLAAYVIEFDYNHHNSVVLRVAGRNVVLDGYSGLADCVFLVSDPVRILGLELWESLAKRFYFSLSFYSGLMMF